jgi:hypothetical protein
MSAQGGPRTTSTAGQSIGLGLRRRSQTEKIFRLSILGTSFFFIETFFWIFVSFRSTLEKEQNMYPSMKNFAFRKIFLWDRNIGLRS